MAFDALHSPPTAIDERATGFTERIDGRHDLRIPSKIMSVMM
ncbi:hypothetical protein [Micromonospora sp. NPDC049799]